MFAGPCLLSSEIVRAQGCGKTQYAKALLQKGAEQLEVFELQWALLILH